MEGIDKDSLKENSIKVKEIINSIDNVKNELLEKEIDDAYDYVKWLKIKTELRYTKKIDNSLYILNNCIYWAHLGLNIGSEQDLHRPVLIVQTSKKSTICTIIPLTLERLNDGYWYHIDLENGISTALVEHLRVISKKRITKPYRSKGKIDTITKKDWEKINIQLSRLYTLKALR